MKAKVIVECNGIRIECGHNHEIFKRELEKFKMESVCTEQFIDMSVDYIVGICGREHPFWEINTEDLKTKLMDL